MSDPAYDVTMFWFGSCSLFIVQKPPFYRLTRVNLTLTTSGVYGHRNCLPFILMGANCPFQLEIKTCPGPYSGHDLLEAHGSAEVSAQIYLQKTPGHKSADNMLLDVK